MAKPNFKWNEELVVIPELINPDGVKVVKNRKKFPGNQIPIPLRTKIWWKIRKFLVKLKILKKKEYMYRKLIRNEKNSHK